MSPDEIISLAHEIASEAAEEIHIELVRRGIREEAAMAAVVVVMLAQSVGLANELHKAAAGKTEEMSRESLHKKVDEFWNALDETVESRAAVHAGKEH